VTCPTWLAPEHRRTRHARGAPTAPQVVYADVTVLHGICPARQRRAASLSGGRAACRPRLPAWARLAPVLRQGAQVRVGRCRTCLTTTRFTHGRGAWLPCIGCAHSPRPSLPAGRRRCVHAHASPRRRAPADGPLHERRGVVRARLQPGLPRGKGPPVPGTARRAARLDGARQRHRVHVLHACAAARSSAGRQAGAAKQHSADLLRACHGMPLCVRCTHQWPAKMGYFGLL